MGLTTPSTSALPAPEEIYKPYTSEELAALSKKYSPSQLASIRAGEEAISASDLAVQATFRSDPFGVNYLDDFSTHRPVIDKAVRAPESNYDPNQRMKTEKEVAADLAAWVQDLPEEPDRVEWMKFFDNTRLTVGKEEAELNPHSSLAPELPVMKDPNLRYPKAGDSEEDDPRMQALLKSTGFTIQQIRQLHTKNLVQHRVVNQTRMGKIQSLYFLTVAGNGRGLLGVGEGKAAEPENARKQAYMAAIRHMRPVRRYEERTIYGEVEGKVGAAEVRLMARPPGFGVRCQQYIFEMCRCAGITDLAARVTRSRNPMNVIKATFEALQSQRLPDDIARGRGKKLVDVRKVYYGEASDGGEGGGKSSGSFEAIVQFL
ncbi:MAG: 28S ribosomal protein S5, mitochondrial [Candelina mexicana]|nr:MAG: 28S ribosomal protein S5, mitochondrial [Candelina mexicana]